MATFFGKARRQLRKRVEINTEYAKGFTTEPDGFESAEIKVTVDMAELARIYGVGAMQNKSGRSRYMGGCVVIEVVSRQREE